MNNRTTRTGTLSAIVVLIFTAATLVVGGSLATTSTTHSALAYKKRGDGGNRNGNTVTEHKMKDLAWQEAAANASPD